MPFLLAAFTAAKPKLPVMLDTDGQRPEALDELLPHLAMVQVTVEFAGGEASFDRALQTIGQAAKAKCAHALVLAVAHRAFGARPISDYVGKLERGGLFVDVKCQADARALREQGLSVWRL